MMTNTKWLRRALLGGVALGVMASGVQADELAELKAQLEGLQSRVDQLEQQPSTAGLPAGTSFLTMSRGSADINDKGTFARARDQRPSDRGFTIAVTPTADLPAPVAEVVVYGYVKGDVIYDLDKDLGDAFYVPGLWTSSGRRDKNHIRLHAKQTRFGIRSRTDTAVGQIRTQIEGDFFADPDISHRFRLRHAIGEWDITPHWTFLAGQTWRTAVLLPIGVTTVDFSSSAGPFAFPRAAQVRLTYRAGPISWAVAAERPRFTSDARWPDFSSYLQFDAPGGHQFIVTGTVSDHRRRAFHDSVGWAVQAGANINLADIATLTVGGLYGKQQHCQYLNQVGAFCGSPISARFHDDGDFIPIDDFFTDKGWGVVAGISFGLTDTTTFNVSYGISELDNDFSGINHVTTQTLHGNILWRPVRQMQLGWEVMWGEYRFSGGDWRHAEAKKHDDAIRAQFGAWFFF